MKLEEWEYVCDKCDGEGVWCNKDKCKCPKLCYDYQTGSKEGNHCLCPKCKGWGKVDFITNIVGKKKVNNLIWNVNGIKIWGQKPVKRLTNADIIGDSIVTRLLKGEN